MLYGIKMCYDERCDAGERMSRHSPGGVFLTARQLKQAITDSLPINNRYLSAALPLVTKAKALMLLDKLGGSFSPR